MRRGSFRWCGKLEIEQASAERRNNDAERLAMMLAFGRGNPHNLLTRTRRADPRIGARWFVRTLLRLSGTVFVVVGVCVLIAVGLIGVAMAAPATTWIAAEGKHVVISWTPDPRSQLTDAEQSAQDHRGTRDASRLTRRRGYNCSLSGRGAAK